MEIQHTDLTHSEQINELAAAMAKSQMEIANPKKSSSNPYFESKYADLAAVIDSCKKVLASNGIAVFQPPVIDGDKVGCTTLLVHSSGQFIRGTLLMKPDKMNPQAMGSVITYARRYSLQGMVGIAGEDDDANSATGDLPPKKDSVQPDKKQRTANGAPPTRESIREEFAKPSREYSEVLGDLMKSLSREQDFMVAWGDKPIESVRSFVNDTRPSGLNWVGVVSCTDRKKLSEVKAVLMETTAQRVSKVAV